MKKLSKKEKEKEKDKEKEKEKKNKKKNKECECCCIEGIMGELIKRTGHIVTVYTKHNQSFSRRIHKVDFDILLLEDVAEPAPTFIVIPLCEISTFVYEIPS